MKRTLLAALLCVSVSVPAAAAPPAAAPPGYTRNVAVVLYDGVELLDFAGPGEVLKAAGGLGAVDGKAAFRVYTVAASRATLVSQGFVSIVPEFAFADAPKPDLVVVPGGDARRLLDDASAMAWIRNVVPAAELTMTVCTGAFVLARTGVLAGKDVTTHFASLARLQAAVPDARVQPGRRFVDNGTFVTTAGVSAGIDGALHVVARLLGRAVADRTARYMEYHWSPEATAAGTYALLNPSTDDRGRALQLAGIHLDEGRPEDARRICRELVSRDAADASAWSRLGEAQMMMGRFGDAADSFERASARPDLRATATYNRACALARAGRRAEALMALEAAVLIGGVSRGAIENDDDLSSLRADPKFADILASAGTPKAAPKS